MKEVERHGDDLSLEFGGAGVHVALQDICVRELAEDLTEIGVVIVIAGIQRSGDAAEISRGVSRRPPCRRCR